MKLKVFYLQNVNVQKIKIMFGLINLKFLQFIQNFDDVLIRQDRFLSNLIIYLIFYSKILIFFYRLISYLKINEQMLLDFVKVLQQEIILFLLKFVQLPNQSRNLIIVLAYVIQQAMNNIRYKDFMLDAQFTVKLLYLNFL